MMQWAGIHPVLFTILALPVVLTGCGLVLAAICNVEISYRKP